MTTPPRTCTRRPRRARVTPDMPRSEWPVELFVADLRILLGRSPSTIRRWADLGNFPRPISPAGAERSWSRTAIVGWLAAREGAADGRAP